MEPLSPSLAQLLDRAVAGEPAAIQDVLLYLNSANPDLRHMMQGALHATHTPALWQRLLHCTAHDCWPPPEPLPASSSSANAPTSPVAPSPKRQAAPSPERPVAPSPSRRFSLSRAQQSIVEAFVVDSSFEPHSEREAKLAVLLPALAGGERLDRWAAAYLLGLRGHLPAIPALDEILSTSCPPDAELDPEACVHWQLRAIQALVALEDPACGPLLIKALANRQRAVHHAAGLALNDLGRNAEPALLAALHHPDQHVRWHAARSLGQIGDLRAIDALTEGLYDDNQEVRWATARALSVLDTPAIPAILHVLSSQPINEPLRQSAYHALNSMYCLRQPDIHAYLAPLLDVLRQPGAIPVIAIDAPLIAQRLLEGWKGSRLVS